MRMLALRKMISVSIASLLCLGGTVANSTKESAVVSGVVLTRDVTANVEKRLMWLVEASEENNPPDGNSNFLETLPESDDEPTVSPLDEQSIHVSDVPGAEFDSHINETADLGATSINFKMNGTVLKENSPGAMAITPVGFAGNPIIIKPSFISGKEEKKEEEEAQPTSEEAKPTPYNPYDPTNEGTSKGGRHKGQHLHVKTAGFQSVPIIRMGEGYEDSSGLRIVKPWNS